MSDLTLTELLQSQQDATAVPADISAADRALLVQDYAEAMRLYAEEGEPSPMTRAKHGFSAAMSGDDARAEALLTHENVGTHPLAIAILAWVLGGRNGHRMRGFGSASVIRGHEHRRATVSALLDVALAVEKPPQLVFVAAFELLGTYSDDSKAQAARARVLYPEWALAHALHAMSQRRNGNFESNLLDDLMRTLPSASREEVFREAYIYALKLERWDDAERVVNMLDVLVQADPPSSTSTLAALAEMHAMVALHRARAGETEAYETILVMLEPFAAASAWFKDGSNPLNVPRFLLDAALETRNDANVRDAARELVERAWATGELPSEGLESWSPDLSTPSLEGVLRFGHFGFAFAESWRRVELMLDHQLAARWRLLLAADAVLADRADVPEAQIMREAELAQSPFWALRAAFQVFAADPTDFARAGEVLAMISEVDDAQSIPTDDAPFDLLDTIPLDMHGSEQVVEMIEGALMWLQRTPKATGRGLLRGWAQCGIDNGGAKVVAQIAQLSLSRGESEVARSALLRTQEADEEAEAAALTPQIALERRLAEYPDPAQTLVSPEQLTLLEAAALIALLRASPLDHVRWTLTPLRDLPQKFEPTRKFISVLFDLMQKGVIAVDASTPQAAIWLEDGKITAYLDQVVWRVSTHTLELQRGVRDLPRRDWPASWRSHAPVLARDLGVEELVMYQEHLLLQRDLPVPEGEEVRSIYRVQLERLSIAQCYYLTHKTMRETLDYQARYRPGQKQLQARTLNLLRGNGEKAAENGWDTRFDRVRDLPPSLLHEALHDVLTRWGTRAFEEPVMLLALDDSESSPTRH